MKKLANDLTTITNILEKHEMLTQYPDFISRDIYNVTINSTIYNHMLREMLIEQHGFVLPVKSWIRPLAAFIADDKCLEIMCGSGMLSKCLSDCGVDIIATDDGSWAMDDDIYYETHWFDNPWYQVEKLDCIKAIEKYGKDVRFIICCWPIPFSDSTLNSLLAMRRVNPDAYMIYIGETKNGCCANNAFFEEAKMIPETGIELANIHFIPFHLMYDYILLYK